MKLSDHDKILNQSLRLASVGSSNSSWSAGVLFVSCLTSGPCWGLRKERVSDSIKMHPSVIRCSQECRIQESLARGNASWFESDGLQICLHECVRTHTVLPGVLCEGVPGIPLAHFTNACPPLNSRQLCCLEFQLFCNVSHCQLRGSCRN